MQHLLIVDNGYAQGSIGMEHVDPYMMAIPVRSLDEIQAELTKAEAAARHAAERRAQAE